MCADWQCRAWGWQASLSGSSVPEKSQQVGVVRLWVYRVLRPGDAKD